MYDDHRTCHDAFMQNTAVIVELSGRVGGSGGVKRYQNKLLRVLQTQDVRALLFAYIIISKYQYFGSSGTKGKKS